MFSIAIEGIGIKSALLIPEFLLKGIQQRTTRLVSPERLGQVAVFLQNSNHPCRVRVQVDRVDAARKRIDFSLEKA